MKLRKYLEHTGMSQAAFAEKVGLSLTAIKTYLSGVRRPSWRTAIRIERITKGMIEVGDMREGETKHAPPTRKKQICDSTKH